MTNNTIQLLLQLLCILIALLSFCLLLTVGIRYKPQKIILHTYQELRKYTKNNKWIVWNYEKINVYLSKNGASFHFGKWINPIRFMAMRFIVAGLGLLIGMEKGVLLGIGCGFCCFYLPNILLKYMNNKDNENLLPEIKLVYNALAMQIRAGVYVTDALSECYGSVREKRLRTALLSLSGDIVMKADIDDALERFQDCFDNSYIDSLCITIQQAMESGQAVELLADIGEQIKDMEAMVLNRKKGALDRSITFYQLGILAAVMAVVLYSCITHVFEVTVLF